MYLRNELLNVLGPVHVHSSLPTGCDVCPSPTQDDYEATSRRRGRVSTAVQLHHVTPDYVTDAGGGASGDGGLPALLSGAEARLHVRHLVLAPIYQSRGGKFGSNS